MTYLLCRVIFEGVPKWGKTKSSGLRLGSGPFQGSTFWCSNPKVPRSVTSVLGTACFSLKLGEFSKENLFLSHSLWERLKLGLKIAKSPTDPIDT